LYECCLLLRMLTNRASYMPCASVAIHSATSVLPNFIFFLTCLRFAVYFHKSYPSY
jgi:hypothetical protein